MIWKVWSDNGFICNHGNLIHNCFNESFHAICSSTNNFIVTVCFWRIVEAGLHKIFQYKRIHNNRYKISIILKTYFKSIHNHSFFLTWKYRCDRFLLKNNLNDKSFYFIYYTNLLFKAETVQIVQIKISHFLQYSILNSGGSRLLGELEW